MSSSRLQIIFTGLPGTLSAKISAITMSSPSERRPKPPPRSWVWTWTLSGVVWPTIMPRIFIVLGDWLPDQTSITPFSALTVTFSGSMHMCAT